MNRKLGILVSVSVLTLSLIGVNHAFAENTIKDEPTLMDIGLDKEEFHHKRHQMNPEIIKKRAEELGIETEGKDTEVLAREVHEAKILEKAKELNFRDVKRYPFTSKSQSVLYLDISLKIWEPENNNDPRILKLKELLEKE